MPEPGGTLLGFDYGERRIGVAVGHRDTGLAAPLTTVVNQIGQTNWAALLEIIDAWKPSALVVGLPTHMDGSHTAMTKRVSQFYTELAERSALPTHPADERASSQEAEHIIKQNRKQGRKRTQKGDTDKIAAALILQHWMESNNVGG